MRERWPLGSKPHHDAVTGVLYNLHMQLDGSPGQHVDVSPHAATWPGHIQLQH